MATITKPPALLCRPTASIPFSITRHVAITIAMDPTSVSRDLVPSVKRPSWMLLTRRVQKVAMEERSTLRRIPRPLLTLSHPAVMLAPPEEETVTRRGRAMMLLPPRGATPSLLQAVPIPRSSAPWLPPTPAPRLCPQRSLSRRGATPSVVPSPVTASASPPACPSACLDRTLRSCSPGRQVPSPAVPTLPATFRFASMRPA